MYVSASDIHKISLISYRIDLGREVLTPRDRGLRGAPVRAPYYSPAINLSLASTSTAHGACGRRDLKNIKLVPTPDL
ncbi:hypothetical protein JYU34_008747 [Plutella xylostella]|uniref:Uncharacterized protein n=1 Tax=Plutella xylostella TaxID=51655 RepID=A0ABQ7QLP6_PLUXY|nr:hypothetical protein JYU34_008747 [Plutella xylostella]